MLEHIKLTEKLFASVNSLKKGKSEEPVQSEKYLQIVRLFPLSSLEDFDTVEDAIANHNIGPELVSNE